ncbi:hypothetical protein ABID21_004811 [Pseudorhizobium tarimense]|uniref:Uncharacterized protein n=1 Tax=Pseudorhizobium tarimense TaxID=1079109 RepID=A0ABV2HDP8_9HYPH|nr:hypothetical protein [Pseudorhizobium tarimense]
MGLELGVAERNAEMGDRLPDCVIEKDAATSNSLVNRVEIEPGWRFITAASFAQDSRNVSASSGGTVNVFIRITALPASSAICAANVTVGSISTNLGITKLLFLDIT